MSSWLCIYLKVIAELGEILKPSLMHSWSMSKRSRVLGGGSAGQLSSDEAPRRLKLSTTNNLFLAV